MANTLQKLDALVARVRTLPEARQMAAIGALTEIAEEPYQISSDELAVLRSSLEEEMGGENLVDAETVELLNESWA